MSWTNVFKIIYAECSYTGVSRIVSDKKQWVEQTLERLGSSFDKKALLEQVERFEDPELRSIITTSLTGSMAKRKLEQYRARMDSNDAPQEPPDPEPKATDQDPEASGETGPIEDPKADTKDAPADPKKRKTPHAQEEPRESEPSKPEPLAASDPDDEPRRVDFTREPEPIVRAKQASAKTKRAPDPKPQVPETTRAQKAPAPDAASVDATSEPAGEAPAEPTRDEAKDMPDSRFDALEETILSSKSNKDLSVPDLPDGMLDSIRQLKKLARSKVHDKPKEKHRIIAAEPTHVKSDELLEALDDLAPRSGEKAMRGTPAADTPASEEPSAPSYGGDRSDEVAELFDEFLERDAAKSEPSAESAPPSGPARTDPEQKSALFAQPAESATPAESEPAPSADPPAAPADPVRSTRPAEPAPTASAEPEPAPSSQPAESAPPAQPTEPATPAAVSEPTQPDAEPAESPEQSSEEPTDHGIKPLAPTRSGSGEQAAVEQKSESDSTADLEAFDAFFESPDTPVGTERVSAESEPSEPSESEPSEPAQPAAEPSEKSLVPRSVEEISKRFQALLGSMHDVNREIPHPTQDEPSSPEDTDSPSGSVRTTDDAPAKTYDGSWIESCESIGDVLDVLDSVEGSIEDVRNTVALFVLPVSDELASTIRTAQNRDELELMLRRALTVTIDDAFERTKARFEKEQQDFEHEAFEAAETFDEAVSKAVRTHEEQTEPRIDERTEPRVEPRGADVPQTGTDNVPEEIEDVYESVEEKSADDLSQPVQHHAKPGRTISERVHELIALIHREVEQGSYDAAVAHVGDARELISRQIKIKQTRGDPIVDDKMADFELKALVLDLEILQTRQ